MERVNKNAGHDHDTMFLLLALYHVEHRHKLAIVTILSVYVGEFKSTKVISASASLESKS